MNICLTGSIRANLVLVVVASVLPMLAVILLFGMELRKREIVSVEEEAMRLAQSLAQQQERDTASMRQLLTTLASLPEVQRLDVAECEKQFRKQVSINPAVANLVLLDETGMLLASANPSPRFSFANMRHVQQVRRTKSFSAGECITCPITGKPVLAFACPVLDGTGSHVASLAMSINFDLYGGSFRHARLPEQSTLTLVDHAGLRLAHYPTNPLTPPGAPVQPAAKARYLGADTEGISSHTGSDGVARYWAFKQLRLQPEEAPYMVAVVGIPQAVARARADSITRTLLFWVGLAGLLSLALARFVGQNCIVQSLTQLVDVAKRLGQGDLNARSGLFANRGTLGELARAFDSMAQALKQREEQRDRAEEAQRFLAAIVESSDDAIVGKNMEGVITTWNNGAARLYGYDADEALGQPFSMLVPEDMLQQAHDMVQRIRCGQPVVRAETLRKRKDASLVDVSLTISPILDQQGAIVGISSVARDISAQKRLEQELTVLAKTDALTGASNRRHFLEQAAAAVSMSKRYEEPLAFLMIDIDHFKSINDTFGHAVGDEVLRAMSARCKATLRETDAFGRLGGEEFCAALTHCDLQTARQTAERLRQSLLDMDLATDKGFVRFTVSMGISAFRQDDASASDAIRRADDALYAAKRAGRNRIESC